MTIPPALITRARSLLAERLGLDCPEHRLTDLEAALVEGVRRARLRSPEAFLARLVALPGDAREWTHLAQRLTVGETYFFRDRACFDALERHVLPALAAARRAQGGGRLSVWSAGCSTGEEAYSLAMLLDQLFPETARWPPGVLGTDVNPASLEAARGAVYRPWALRDTPLPMRDRYFVRRDGGYEVVPEICSRVQFASLNVVVNEPPASAVPVDLLLCRNLLMYLSRPAAERAVERLRSALAPDGWLVVAAAEAWAESFRPLVPVNFPGTILFTSEASARRLGMPPPPEVVTRRGPAPAVAAHTDRRERPDATARRRASAPSHELAKEPTHAAALSRVRELADRGELDEALRVGQSLAKRSRLDPAVHLLLSAIQQERGDLAQAQAALRRALYLDPDCVEAHAALGHILMRRGETRRARRHFETAARLGAGREEVP
jgi:chemotaxis protein methyltransferase CheR